MPASLSINYELSYAGEAARVQAARIFEGLKARLRKEPGKKIALIYAANNKQAKLFHGIYEARKAKEILPKIVGHGQAELFIELIKLINAETLKTPEFSGKIRILPVATSLNGDENGPGNIVTREMIDRDLGAIQVHLQNGYDVEGIINDSNDGYAIGGGRSIHWYKTTYTSIQYKGEDVSQGKYVQAQLAALEKDIKVDLDLKLNPLPTSLKSSLGYDYATLSDNRFHLFSAHASENMKAKFPNYQHIKGDSLKTMILQAFKDSLENVVDGVKLASIIHAFKRSDEYAILKRGQGLATRVFALKTDSIKAFDKMVADAELRSGGQKILEINDSASDPSVWVTSTGFYKVNSTPLGAGGWGSVYAAQYHSHGGVVGGQPCAIKQMKEQHDHSAILDKEHVLFQKAYPDQHFERFSKDNNACLSMPLFSGIPLDQYLLSRGDDLSQGARQLMAAELLTDYLNHMQVNGVTHHDIKPKNTLFDPLTKKMHILDFGCAEEAGVPIKYQGMHFTKYAIEYMPPEYVSGTNASAANDIYSMALSLAEILGMSKRALVKARMERALTSVEDGVFKRELLLTFEQKETLDATMYTRNIRAHQKTPAFEQFIQNYVSEQYDFAPYQELLGEGTIALLNTMQAKNPEDRPSAQECIEQLRQAMVASDVSEIASMRRCM